MPSLLYCQLVNFYEKQYGDLYKKQNGNPINSAITLLGISLQCCSFCNSNKQLRRPLDMIHAEKIQQHVHISNNLSSPTIDPGPHSQFCYCCISWGLLPLLFWTHWIFSVLTMEPIKSVENLRLILASKCSLPISIFSRKLACHGRNQNSCERCPQREAGMYQTVLPGCHSFTGCCPLCKWQAGAIHYSTVQNANPITIVKIRASPGVVKDSCMAHPFQAH